MEPEIIEHWADDPDVEFEPESSSFVPFVLAVVITVAMMLSGMVAMHLWFQVPEPPVVTFKAPLPPAWAANRGIWIPANYRVRCLAFDGQTEVVQPNYSEPFCSAAAAKKRGWW